jgi:transposase-like protein
MERARVKELEAEVARLRMENEFLKKAAAFFARTHP